ncbi:MAG: hypothetical protein IH602_01685 [Bryobacteraceae bacterium]|nr:hypothetical protein [Bryobacteraceae bacterium]
MDSNLVKVTDPSTAKRRTTSDALGRITSVVEAPTTSAFTTSYVFSSVQGPSGLSRESYRESYCLFL